MPTMMIDLMDVGEEIDRSRTMVEQAEMDREWILSLFSPHVAANEEETLEAQARAANKKSSEDARQKADRIIGNAEVEARAILTSAQSRVAQRLQQLEAEERKFNHERESIVAYLENLKQVIEQIKKDVG